MLGIRLIATLGILVCCCDGLQVGVLFDPSKDDAIDTSDEDSVHMIDGHPDMRSIVDMMQKREQVQPEENSGFNDNDVPTDIMPDDVTTMPTGSQQRRRRFVLDDPKRQWTHGIIPYQFHTALPNSYRNNYLNRVFKEIEYWTHFRFVPWNASVPELYNLTHKNYLIFVKSGYSCWSYVGNVRKLQGQRISCCRYNRCLHELGHALGFYHEQSNPLRDDYIRINFENIMPGAARNFKKGCNYRTMNFGYYDANSVMSYGGRKLFSKNGFDTVTSLDEEALYLQPVVKQTTFYMFYEAQAVYRMKDTKCPGFSMSCVNDGYVSYIDGSCRCRCTSGMDYRTGCATPIGTDIWPDGFYSVVKVGSVCPSALHHELISFSSNTSSRQFLEVCTKRYQLETTTAHSWGTGIYCLIRTFSQPCPSGFYDNPIQHNVTTFTLCCRDDGLTSNPVTLPLQKPFTLLTGSGSDCQQVTGSIVANIYSSELAVFGLKGCRYRLSKDSTQPGCGDMVHLGDNNKQVSVTSPAYPADYTDEESCTWFFKGPPGSSIKLEFSVFEVHTENIHECNGHVEIRHVLPGQPGVKYCGSGFDKTIISHSESLQMILSGTTNQQSKGASFSKRFNATITILREKDLCYTNGGRDDSYHGKVNITRNFKPCLPWDKVINCRHHTFSETAMDLEENFCRNPGHGTEPWCYTDAETCDRDYCDVCQLRRCFDLFDDCQDIIRTDKEFCGGDPEASRGCRRSCGMCRTMETLKTLTSVRCPSPDKHHPDVLFSAELKAFYQVGEEILYECLDGNTPKQHESVCASDGTWSRLGRACQGNTCFDERQDCATLLHRTPAMCRDHREFVSQKCAKTCAICSSFNRLPAKDGCPIMEEPFNAVMKTNKSIVHGDVVEYACHDGFVLQGGNLQRACQIDGSLTGQTPSCIAEDEAVTEMVHAPIRRRLNAGWKNRAYTLSSDSYRINRTGEITTWTFYSLFSGRVQFQVWRQYRDTKWFKLVGIDNIQDTRNDRLVSIQVPVERRTQVRKGDIIAIYFPNDSPGGVTFDPCKSSYNSEGVSRWVPLQPQWYWRSGGWYAMMPINECRLFSISAKIGPLS